MTRLTGALSLMAAVVPNAALAQTAPVPLEPERWVHERYRQCDGHSCYAEGVVRFAVTVSPTGRVTGCEILESSRNWRLDQDTCQLLTRYARFSPATDENGNRVEGRWESRIHWKVPGPDPWSEPPRN